MQRQGEPCEGEYPAPLIPWQGRASIARACSTAAANSPSAGVSHLPALRVAFRVLGLPAPGLPRPRRCRACKTSMELIGDFLFSDDDIAKIEAVRFWICSGCGDGIREWYCYPKQLDPL